MRTHRRGPSRVRTDQLDYVREVRVEDVEASRDGMRANASCPVKSAIEGGGHRKANGFSSAAGCSTAIKACIVQRQRAAVRLEVQSLANGSEPNAAAKRTRIPLPAGLHLRAEVTRAPDALGRSAAPLLRVQAFAWAAVARGESACRSLLSLGPGLWRSHALASMRIEVAPSGRSVCRVCRCRIERGAVRLRQSSTPFSCLACVTCQQARNLLRLYGSFQAATAALPTAEEQEAATRTLQGI